jgi:hypothetical protein
METRLIRVRVDGYCPMGCGETLSAFEATHSPVTCSSPDCPKPDAVAVILSNPETEHVVNLSAFDFTIWHPLRERLDNELLNCDLHGWLRSFSGPPAPVGTYRAVCVSGGWSLVEVEAADDEHKVKENK